MSTTTTTTPALDRVRVVVDVDRASAILAGSNQWGKLAVWISLSALTDEERAELAKLPADRDGDLNAATDFIDGETRNDDSDMPTFAKADEAAVRAVLAWRIATRADRIQRDEKAQAEKIAHTEAKIAEWMTRPDDKLIVQSGNFDFRVEHPDFEYRKQSEAAPSWKAYKERFETLHTIAKQRGAELREEQKRAREEEDAEREREAGRKDEILNSFAHALLSPEQQRRYTAGYLPESELLDAIRDQLFAPLDSFPRYERLTRADIVEADPPDYDDEDAEVEYRTEKADEATAEEFATYEAIEAVVNAKVDGPSPFPIASKCELRKHNGGWKESRDWAVHSHAVLVTLTVDDCLTVSREYAAP